MIVNGSVLDLPIDRQRAIAAREGMALEEWRAHVIKSHKEADTLRAEHDANRVRFEDLSPEDQEWARRFQARVDSEQLTNDALNRRAEQAKHESDDP